MAHIRQALSTLIATTAFALSAFFVASPVLASKCGNVNVSNALGDCATGTSGLNPIYAFLETIIQYASGVFGLLMVLMIVLAGLQYVVSDGSPDVAKAAKDRIRNAFTGFVLFVLMFGLFQVLLPPDVRVFQ